MELELFTTFGNGNFKDKFHQVVAFTEDQGTEDYVVNIYSEMEFETLEGFGGAITDSAAYVYSLMDEKGEPNHVGNFCHAPFLYDTVQKKLLPQLILQHFQHFSHYLVSGSIRVGHSKYTESIDVTTYKRPDESLALVLLNKNDSSMPVNIRLNGQLAQIVLFPESITTCTIKMAP